MYIDKENSEGRRRTQAERREGTRRALVRVARRLFAESGYAGVSIEEITKCAGMTKGALYHHYADKRELFRAVAEGIEEELDEVVLGAARKGMEENPDPFGALMAGTRAYLEACLRPEVRVMLVDGPSALGWEAWRELDARHAVSQIEAGLEDLMDRGAVERQPTEPLAHLLHGAILEAALYVASAAEPEWAKAEVWRSLKRLLEGLGRIEDK